MAPFRPWALSLPCAGDDPDGDSAAAVEYRAGGGAYQAGFPLTRVNSTRFAGSLFWLKPGTAYDVRVTFSDPDGALHGVTVEATASTRAEIAIPPPTHSYPTTLGTTAWRPMVDAATCVSGATPSTTC